MTWIRTVTLGSADEKLLKAMEAQKRTLIASWFNYINRVADALGVGRE